MSASIPVLTVWLAGTAYRFGAQTISVVHDDGGEETIPGGLDTVELDEAGDDSPGGASVEWDPGALDLAELAQAGSYLLGAVAEVAVIEDGDEWADREVLVYGTISGGTYGEVGEMASAQLGATWTDGGMVPPPSAVAGLAYDETSRGQTLPWIIGKPTCAPSVLHTTGGTLVIAGHRVLATSVFVRGVGSSGLGPIAAMIVYHLTIEGRIVATVNLAAAPVLAGFTEFVVDWSETQGGHLSVTGVECPRSLPDVALVLLSYCTVPVDRASFASATWAAGYLLDVFLDDSDSPVQILADALEGIPAELEAGPRGLRLVPTAGAANTLDPGPIVDLDDGRAQLDGGVVMDGQAPPSVVTVRYRPGHTGALTLTATLDEDDGPRIGYRAFSRGGPAPVIREVECPHVCDRGTAWRIAGAVMREGASRRTVQWTVPLGDLDVARAERVRVTRAGLHLDAHPAWIEHVARDFEAGTATITARLIDDPTAR